MARPKGTPKTGGRAPGSRNKLTADVKALAQLHGADAIGVLAEIMNDESHPPAARVAAAKELMDRGFGKSMQPTEITGEDGGPIQHSIKVSFVSSKH